MTHRMPGRLAAKALAKAERDCRKQIKAGMVCDGVYARAIVLVCEETRLSPEDRASLIEEIDRLRMYDEAEDAIAAGDPLGWDSDLYLVRERDLLYLGCGMVEALSCDLRDVAGIEKWARRFADAREGVPA